MAEGDPKPEEQTVPKARMDELNERMKAAEKRAEEAEKKAEKLESEKTAAEQQRDEEQGQYKDLAEKRKTEMDNRDETIKGLRRDLMRKDQLSTFRRAASGIVRNDALDDAFSMLSAEELDKIDASDEDGMKRMATSLAEQRTYLADTARGTGSGGSDSPVPGGDSKDGKQGVNWTEIKKNKRKSVFS